MPEGYPREWEADVVLRDGSVAHVRPIRPDDGPALQAFHSRQSQKSVYLRFFAAMPRLSDRDTHRFTHVDYRERVALVMIVRDQIVAVGRYDRLDGPADTTAEVAFNVADDMQGKGIGSVLLEHLADIGREAGVRRFTADVLPQNRKMISVFADAGYEVSHEFDDGVISVAFDIEPTEQSLAVRLAREHRAESVSMRRLLTPGAIAVVGVGRSRGSVGAAVYRHLREGGFTGTVYPINRAAAKDTAVPGDPAAGSPVLASVRDVPEPIALAVIAVPADQVSQVVHECADAGAVGVVVVSAGFGESGDEGARLQEALLRQARALGLRVLGPTSFGLINTDPAVRMNASLAPRLPEAGGLGLFAQSGALGIAVLADAHRRGLGLSSFASAGNRVDISGNDLMQYWLDDEATTAVGLYLESVGNPRKFSRIARQLAQVKPVIAIKSDSGPASVPPGHRVRLTRERPEAFGSMLRQAGVIRVANLHQLFDVAQLVLHQPLPAGPGVAVVTNSAALGVLASDAVRSWDLTVTRGPITLGASAGSAEVSTAVQEALEDDRVDSLVVCFVPPVDLEDDSVTTSLAEVVAGATKPVVATVLGTSGVTPGHLPSYPMPEDAVRALAAVTRYADWRGREQGTVYRLPGVNRSAAAALVQSQVRDQPAGVALDAESTTALLQAYGIELWPSRTVTDADAAVSAADEVGYPVVLKGADPLVRHQPGHQWVHRFLTSPEQVRAAFAAIQEGMSDLGVEGISVQRMAPTGVVVEITSHEDPLFGPVVGFGIAGVPVELLGDIAYRFPPLTDVDIAEMVSSVRAAPLLDGYRGTMPVHLDALHDLVARVGAMAEDLPDLSSLRLNPVMCHEDGVAVLGADVELAPAPGRNDGARRALTR